MVRTGKLRERVVIQTRVSAESGDSATDITYADVATVNCNAINIAGKQLIGSRGANFAADYRFEIRWYSGLTKQHMLLYRDHMTGEDMRLEIISIQNLDERRRRMLIFGNLEAEESSDQNPSPVSTDVPTIP